MTPENVHQLSLEALDAARARVPQPTWAALTAMQQRFVAALVAFPEKTQGECALLAGMSPRRATTGGASAMAAQPKVRAALDALRVAAGDKAESDLLFVKRRLKENDLTAYAAEDIGASNGALGLYAKVTGLTEKRVRISFDDPAQMLAQLQAMPLEERRRVIREMLAE